MESGHLTLGLGSLAATTNHQRKRNRDTKSYWYFPGLIKTGIESQTLLGKDDTCIKL